jgi:Protein of unknown function (DUF3467)
MNETPTTQPQINFSEPEQGQAECYANHVQIFWSGIDLTLVFGKLMHSANSIQRNELDVENRSTVTMPWSLAKLIGLSLVDAVSRYEKNNGEIKLPAEYKIP